MNKSKSEKLNSFLDRYQFDNRMISGGSIIRLISDKCGIDFDIDPYDNLHFIGVFNPHKSLDGEKINYIVTEVPFQIRQKIRTSNELLIQWEVYIEFLETNFKSLLEGQF